MREHWVLMPRPTSTLAPCDGITSSTQAPRQAHKPALARYNPTIVVIGSSISHYLIVEKLGEGGMGVVYKAEDTQLRRTVALKFLPRETLDEEEVKARLIREAQAAAALDHPNICQVFGIHEEDGETFIAMAYIDGPSLAEKIKERPLPLEEALGIAAQIGEGLHEAHEHGVVHRDIKPQNILLTTKGQVKILDFGLASLTGRSKLTKTGTTMGTPAYMAPEQLEGRNVDRRADVWALGCVMYEMLTQKSPFEADYEQAIGYGILNEDPEPVTAQRAGLSPEIDRLLSKALAKDRDERYQHADELLADLGVLQKQTGARKASSGRPTISRPAQMTGAVPATMTAGQTVTHAEALPPDAVIVQRSRQLLVERAFAVVLGIALLALAFVYFSQAPPEKPLRRFSFVPPADINNDDETASLALSPNGRHIAYTTSGSSGGLWVQDLDQDQPRQLAGTEGAYLPFWSPDSEFIAYAAGKELRKISVRGGASGLICPLPSPTFREGTWSPNGESIVFSSYVSSGGILYKTSSQGGSSEEFITASEVDQTATSVARPRFVPGAADQVLLFTVLMDSAVEMYVRNLDTGRTAALGLGDRPVYSTATGHLIYQSQRNIYDLWARPFSPETLQFTGSAFPLRQNARQPSISDDGTLAYLDGTARGAQTLVWISRTGELLEAIGQPQPDIALPAPSPDGQRVAVRSGESGNDDIWIHDLIRSTKTRLTFEDVTEAWPAWSPSGREIVYRLSGSPNRIMRRAADGTGEAVALVESEGGLFVPDWSRDGRYLVYFEVNPETQIDIRYVGLGTDGDVGEPVTFLGSPADELFPKLSPDGRFLTYSSNESGRPEIYVRSFPGGDGKRQVSVNGGQQARWRSDGRELYYVEGDTLMAVSVSTEPPFTLGQPQRLFEAPGLVFAAGGTNGGYDVSAAGQRFLTIAPVEAADAAPTTIRIVQNWYEEFRDRE